MNQRRRVLATAVFIAASFAIVPLASAKKVKARSKGSFTERPLTTSKGDLQAFIGPLASPKFGTYDEAGFTMLNVPEGAENIWFFNAGLSYGITKSFEAGVVLPPMQVAPDADAGDLPVFFTWMSSDDEMDFGLRTTVTIPLGGEEDFSFWRVNPGLHALLRFEGARLDIGAFFPMTFFTFGDESETVAGINTPVRASFDVGKRAFVGFDFGLRKTDFDLENDLFLPLGFHGGYTIKTDHIMIDLTASFLWQGFFWAGAPEEAEDKVLEDLFTISFGANVHFDITSMMKAKDEG